MQGHPSSTQADVLYMEYALAKKEFAIDTHKQYCAQLLPFSGQRPLVLTKVLPHVLRFFEPSPSQTISLTWSNYNGTFAPDDYDPLLPHDAGDHMRSEFPWVYGVSRVQEIYQLRSRDRSLECSCVNLQAELAVARVGLRKWEALTGRMTFRVGLP